ncbi:MAG: hypothetical protein HQK72_14145 [Desulfamplus sp.]|nr:hypothetical protein [Desulfamplus sp.]
MLLLQIALTNNRETSKNCITCETTTVDLDHIFLPIGSDIFTIIFPADYDFAADLLWLKFAYLFGYISQTGKGYEYLPPYLDTITDLSPKWKFPYMFGAVIFHLETDFQDEGYHFIEKGIANLPDFWELWLYKGYYLWKFYDDYVQASKVFSEAAKKPGSPSYLAALSTTIALKSGDKEFAEELATEVINSLGDQETIKRILNKFK